MDARAGEDQSNPADHGTPADGYHELESLVAFAGLSDWLVSTPVPSWAGGPRAPGPSRRVRSAKSRLRAARSLAGDIPGLTLGRFRLVKRLPASAGLGGGSADAAAALRSLARANGLSIDDPECAPRPGDGSGRSRLSLSPGPDDDRHWRSTRAVDPAAEDVRSSRQPPGRGADAKGFRRPRARAGLSPQIVRGAVR